MLLQTNPLGSLFSSARSPLGQFIFNRPPDFEDSPQPAARAAAPASSAHAASRPQGGIGGALSRLFGGDFDPRVSGDVNAQAGNRGLIASGLATLLSDREGLGAIAEGIVTGQAAGTTVRQQELARLAEEQAGATRQHIIGTSDFGTPEGRTAAVQQLLAAGLNDEAQKVVNLMGQFAQPQVLTVGDKVRVIDLNSGEITETDVSIPQPPENTTWQQVGDELKLLSDVDGREITSISNPERLSGAELRAITDATFQRATALRNSFRSDTQEIQESLLQAKNALGTIPDLSNIDASGVDASQGQVIVVAFNKLLDAGSVVREGEFNRVADIGGVRARLAQIQNRLTKDGRLSKESVQQIASEINRLQGLMQAAVNRVARQHSQTARDFNVNPEHVLSGVAVDPFADLGG